MKNGTKHQCELHTWGFEEDGDSEPLPLDAFNILVTLKAEISLRLI